MPFLCFMLWVFDQLAHAQGAKHIRKKTDSTARFDLKRKNQVLSYNWKDIELIQDPLEDLKQIISHEMKRRSTNFYKQKRNKILIFISWMVGSCTNSRSYTFDPTLNCVKRSKLTTFSLEPQGHVIYHALKWEKTITWIPTSRQVEKLNFHILNLWLWLVVMESDRNGIESKTDPLLFAVFCQCQFFSKLKL